jgi:hypothetical protein
MALRINNHLIEHEPYAYGRFRLSKEVVRRPKGGAEDGSDDFKGEDIIAYGIPLKRAFEYIAIDFVEDQQLEDWKQYLAAKEAKIEALLERFEPLKKDMYEYLKLRSDESIRKSKGKKEED